MVRHAHHERIAKRFMTHYTKLKRSFSASEFILFFAPLRYSWLDTLLLEAYSTQ
jgi:hypothetical protein